MQQYTNFIMHVGIRMSLDDVESIRFKFTQGGSTLIFKYPSTNAIRIGTENKIRLKWTVSDTARFNSEDTMEMGTFIKLKNSDLNPKTNIVRLKMSRSLFDEEEVLNFD